ncbi:aldehyde reductase (plasmid) [Sphingomonas paeninsulae]|uniref:Aldehyde reductase n=1 Tax=Sphingomonas paeninsulae TaxID=2319844 RepID=A0A494TI11_SPHPE|nr:aldehyde reductase [Sphingomonas paeninsulae]AYJ84805.1 aldehyde reductase [Sphingomonas paeninsulae]
MSGTVLVTGGSGYIAGYTIRQLIAEGWTVRTTVRSMTREAELRGLLSVDNTRLSFHEADLENDAGWAEAVAGCTHVAHIASPFPGGGVRDPQDLIRPARDGVLRALRFAHDAGVRRFVMTSSSAAIAYGHVPDREIYTEADWTNPDYPGTPAYTQSKTIAERAARDWIKAEGRGYDGTKMEFCTVNPVMVCGPVMSADYSTSVMLIEKILSGSLGGAPDFGFGVVDVRDVADIHVRALLADNMAGERLIASGPFLKIVEIAHILKERLGPQGRKIATRKIPDFLIRFAALFSPTVAQVTGELGKTRNMDASHARDVLGWVPRPVEETLVDCARSLIEHGIVRVN